MEQMIVGNYVIGFESVEVVLREGDGGEIYFIPEMGKTSRMKIGADDDFQGLLGTFIHETMEMTMARNRTRWLMSEDLSNDHSGYLFIQTHPEFSGCCNVLAETLMAAQKDLKKAWKKWHKDLKKAKKKVDITESA